MDYLHHASFGIGVLGVVVIVFGVLSGLVRFVRAEFSAARGLVVDEERKKLRHVLGYYLQPDGFHSGYSDLAFGQRRTWANSSQHLL